LILKLLLTKKVGSLQPFKGQRRRRWGFLASNFELEFFIANNTPKHKVVLGG
jgi:hypothetical protein